MESQCSLPRRVGLAALLAVLCLSLHAKTVIELKNGKRFDGAVEKDDGAQVWVRTAAGARLVLAKDSVAKIETVADEAPATTISAEVVVTPSPTPAATPAPSPVAIPAAPPRPAATPAPVSTPVPSAPAATPVVAKSPAVRTGVSVVSTNKTQPAAPPVIAADFDAALGGVTDDVRALRKGGAVWEAASDGLQLRVGDEIRTGQGKAKIFLKGRGELRLPPSSHVVLVAISPDGAKVSIELKGGRLWNSVTAAMSAAQYQVSTPDLVAGVRGTLFNVSYDVGKGSRVAVFEGEVAIQSLKAAAAPPQPLPANTFSTVDQQGQLAPPAPADPAERKEWDEWDQWALDIHQNIASRFVFGGAAIDGLAQLAAQDGQRFEQMTNEANQQILSNRQGDAIDAVRDALLRYCQDTGQPPAAQQGLKALLANPGVANWKGPYVADAALLTDRWGTPLYYELKQSPTSGNIYGEVVSAGPDRIYSKGQADDLKTIVPFYTVLPKQP